MKQNYAEYIRSKLIDVPDVGFDVTEINPILFDFQRDIVRWALKKGRAALFTMTGTGKTLMQLEWARHVSDFTGEKVLIVAPLAVSHQTIDEAQDRLGIDVKYAHNQSEVCGKLTITNYERIERFDFRQYAGIVLDESSILKSHTGAIRTRIIDESKSIPYRLACTATPAPNDYMELGNHSEFLGVMTRTEMLSTFFVHDGGNTSQWRLKGHAETEYWRWIASWAVVLTMPHDLGYDDDGFVLPELNVHNAVIPASKPAEGMLFAMPAETLMERRRARSSTISDRVHKCAEIVNATEKSFLVWCGLNAESEALTKAIPDAVEVKGADSDEHKRDSMLNFSRGKIRVMVTKPSIAGFGMNWQHCHNMAFVGMSDSFEEYFQAVRRCWRFGQKHPVNVYIITSELEGSVVKNIQRKESDAARMIQELVRHTKNIVAANIKASRRESETYTPQIEMELPEWIQ